jgi:hypothetical protein
MKMLIEELGDRRLVDPAKVQTPAPSPSREVSNVDQIACSRGWRVPAVDEVLLDRIGVRRNWPNGQPVDGGATRVTDDAHGGLLKWSHQWTCAPKL